MASAEIKVLVTSDSSDLAKTNDELEATGAVASDVNKKFKDLEATNKNLEKGFVSLKTRVREAKEDLQRAEDRFGPFSKQANEARKRAGELADQMADLNRQVSLLNPEDKIKAFTNLSQGVVGAFAVATGAVQAFGGESEEVQRIAQKLQGALNIVQGVQSIIGLKEAYQDVKVVLGLTAGAQTVLNGATVAGATATEGATVATKGFTAALASNPIGLVAVAIGTLAGAYLLLRDNTEEATEATKEQIQAQDELIEKYYQSVAAQEDRITNARLEIALLKGEITPLQEKILKIEQQRNKALQEFSRDDIINRARVNKEFNLLIQLEELRDQKLKKTKKTTDEGVQSIKSLGIETAKLSEEILKLSPDGFQRLQDTFRILGVEAFSVKEAIEKINKELENTGPISTEVKNTTIDAIVEIEEAEERRRDIAIGLAKESFEFITSLSQQATQKQINDLEEQKNKGIITEEQYQEKLKQIELAAARRQKELSIFAATVAFAEALVKALTTPNPPASLVLAAAVGGLNLAKIIATPLPKFKEGSLNIGGGNLDADGGMHAIVHRGEAIIPADRNKSYHPTLEAIYKKQISPAEINSYVLNRLAGKSGIGRDTVVASVDTYGLSRVLSKNKSVQIENAQTVGKAIASELARGYNRRQVI